MDPVFDTTLRGALALLFFSAALHKLRAPAEFHGTLAEYRLLPGWATRIAAVLIVSGELAAATMLVLPSLRASGAVVAFLLLCAYTSAIAVNLLRGRREINCGCSGAALRQPISAWLLARNAALAAMALLCLLPAHGRALVWIDGASVLGGVLVLAAVYVSSNRMLAIAPLLERLRAA
jgi:hypothetical protein